MEGGKEGRGQPEDSCKEHGSTLFSYPNEEEGKTVRDECGNFFSREVKL